MLFDRGAPIKKHNFHDPDRGQSGQKVDLTTFFQEYVLMLGNHVRGSKSAQNTFFAHIGPSKEVKLGGRLVGSGCSAG